MNLAKRLYLGGAIVPLAILILACRADAEKAGGAGAKDVKETRPAATAPAPAAAGAAKSCPAGMAWHDGGTWKSKRTGADVTVAGFCLDLTEVTLTAYKACVTSGKCSAPDTEAGEGCNWDTKSDPSGFKRGEHPINCVDFAQAEAYCKAQGRRVPTAEEFEWAQRGGAAGTKFPWGDDELPRRVCSRGPNKNPEFMRAPSTCAVGSCPSGDNPQKVHDLSGNLQEWTATPPGKGRPTERLVCGGSTSCQAGSANKVGNMLAAGFCLEQEAAQKFEGVGFRCAK